MKSLLQKFVATVVLMAFTGAANAGMILFLDDPGTVGIIDVIIGDELAVGSSTAKGNTTDMDAAAGAGMLSYNGSVGSYSVSVAYGVSKPLLTGRPSLLDLFSLQFSGGAGAIDIGLTDTDYLGPSGLVFATGGTTNGSISLEAWLDAGNQEFMQGTKLGSTISNGGAFSYTSGQTLAATNPYSLTILSTITHLGQYPKITSFDAEIRVPEPSVIALFAAGLFGMGFARRRKHN